MCLPYSFSPQQTCNEGQDECVAYSISSNVPTATEQLSVGSGHVSSSITTSSHDTDNVVNITNFDAIVNNSSIRNVTPNISNDLNLGHRLQNEQDISTIHHIVHRTYIT